MHAHARVVSSFFKISLQAVGQELVELGDLGGDGEVDGAVTDLDDQAAEDLGVHLVPDLELLALAVLGLGDGGLEAVEGLVVEGLRGVGSRVSKNRYPPSSSSGSLRT